MSSSRKKLRESPESTRRREIIFGKRREEANRSQFRFQEVRRLTRLEIKRGVCLDYDDQKESIRKRGRRTWGVICVHRGGEPHEKKGMMAPGGRRHKKREPVKTQPCPWGR